MTQMSVGDLDYSNGHLYLQGVHLEETLDSYGHIQVWVEGRLQLIHRLIFLKCKGYLPELIDHLNRDPSDNRIENLREINRSYNAVNSDKAWGEIKTRGVHIHKETGKYRARIRKDRKLLCLGLHDTIEQASAAYEKARATLFPGAYCVSNSDN